MKIPAVQCRSNFKSYRAIWYLNGIKSHGAPCSFMIRADKGGTVKVAVQHGWFNESRGYGGQSSTRTFTVTDETAILLARRALDDASAVAGLIDRLIEINLPITELHEWLRYAEAENPEALLWADRRQAAYDRKPAIEIQDQVYLFDSPNQLFRVLGLSFDWIENYGGPGWRVQLRGRSPEAYKARLATAEQIATLPTWE